MGAPGPFRVSLDGSHELDVGLGLGRLGGVDGMLGWAWLTSGWSLGHGEGPAWHACLREGGGGDLDGVGEHGKTGSLFGG